MPARNLYHDAVVDALTADGWTVTDDPHRLVIGRRQLFVDLAGDRAALAADRGRERIAVEVQSFLSKSDIDDFHRAVGQYIVYRVVLQEVGPDRTLYLGVPDEVYTGILSEPLGQLVVTGLGMKVVVFDPAERRIVRWTS
jgi:hypothetical protein